MGFVWRFFLSSIISLFFLPLVVRCSLSKFRQKVKMYDSFLNLVMLFPKTFNGVKHGRTAPVTESVHEK